MPPRADETLFTLSFGGVEFSLAPSQRTVDDANAVAVAANSTANANANDDEMMLSVSKICNGEVLINLKNFIGTLRIKNHNASSVALSTNRPNVSEYQVKNDGNEDKSSIDVLPLPAAEADDDATDAPNPVEDTPSPRASSETKAAESSKQQRKSQQKLNFFDKRGKQGGQKSEMNNTITASKRCFAKDDQPACSTKKSRTANTAEKAAQDIRDFNDFIEERDDEPVEKESSSLPTLGQTIPSQDDESSMDCDGPCNNFDTGAECFDNDRMVSNINNKSVQGTVAPCRRWGQTMTMIDHRRLIVYGGQTIEKNTAKPLADLFVYDMMDGTWTQPIHCDGVARTWHTANFLPERQLLLCFGGEVLDETTGKLLTTDQVMVLDTDIMLWYPPVVSGQIPSGRSGHSSCFIPKTNELVVFGGVKNGKWLNSVAILDTNRWRWSTLKVVGNAPRPRSYHSATVIGSDDSSSDIGNRVVIFGGNDGSECFNGVHVLEVSGEGKKWIWSNPKCKGDAPSPRTGHTATLLNDGMTIMVYGGWDPNTEDGHGNDLIFGDSYLLDTKTWTWRSGPKPRYEKSKNASNGGANRVGHSAVLAPGGENGVQVLAFGGRVHENDFAGDFQSLIVPL